MDHLQLRTFRLALYFVVGLLLGGVSVLSYAETIPATQNSIGAATSPTGYSMQPGGACSTPADCWSKARTSTNPAYDYVRYAAGFGGIDYYDGSFYLVCQNSSGSTSRCVPVSITCPSGSSKVTTSGDALGGTYCRSTTPSYSCPTGQNWTLSGQTCTRPDCVSPEVRDPATGTCKPPPCPAAGSVVGTSASKYGGSGSSNGGLICISQCKVQASACAGNGTSYGCVGPFVATGESCTSQTSPAPVPPEDPRTKCIEKGMAYGTVNGVVVCTAPSQTSQQSSSTQTTTNKDPATNTTTTTTTNQQTSTSCDGDNCTTTTTTTNASTGQSTTQQSDQTKGDFCKENPSSPYCKAEGTFSGACDSGPACTGDAVQCAQAAEVFKLRCLSEELTKETATSKLFDADNPGGTSAQLALAAKALNKDGESDFDLWSTFQSKRQNYVQVSGNCPAYNLSFDFKGRTYNLSQTQIVCELGEWVRLMVHIIAYLFVAKLLSRTFV